MSLAVVPLAACVILVIGDAIAAKFKRDQQGILAKDARCPHGPG